MARPAKIAPRADGPVLRVYLRRSKADEGHQQFSLDVQTDGCRRFGYQGLFDLADGISDLWTEYANLFPQQQYNRLSRNGAEQLS